MRGCSERGCSKPKLGDNGKRAGGGGMWECRGAAEVETQRLSVFIYSCSGLARILKNRSSYEIREER